jgi:hypothetical protein
MIRANCPRDESVQFSSEVAIINDEEGTYIFPCPVCGDTVHKSMDRKARKLLRIAGVSTVDERVESFASVLADDKAMWRGLLD